MRVLLILISLFLVGCASVKYNGSEHSQFMPYYVGKHIDEYISSVEVPDSVVQLSNGNKVYTFSNVQYEYLVVDTFNGAMYCERTFIVSSTGIVLSNSWKGRCK